MINYENGLCGKELIEETVKLLQGEVALCKEEIKNRAQELYSNNEYFDGEPVDPKWFAGQVIKWITK